MLHNQDYIDTKVIRIGDIVSMKGAHGVLINITGGMDMTLLEADEAANRVREEIDPEANIIVGSMMESIDGVGPKVAEVLIEFLSEQRNLDVLHDLASLVTAKPTATGAGSGLAGKTMVFTGPLERMSRAEAKANAGTLIDKADAKFHEYGRKGTA